jgi:hypothetical protein
VPVPIAVHSVTTLEQFTRVLEELVSATSDPYWFRGIGLASTHVLKPSLYRHPIKTAVKERVELESEMLSLFRDTSLPFQVMAIDRASPWDNLFLMQHVGIPTRLLDWTENGHVALFFALLAAEKHRDPVTHNYNEPAGVWALQTRLWNQRSLPSSFNGAIISVRDPIADNYRPTTNLAELMEYPVALRGIYNNPRILAQRGVFVVFGQAQEPMDQLYDSGGFPDGALARVEVPPNSINTVMRSMLRLGYANSMLFPDLDGLARDFRRQFGFPL